VEEVKSILRKNPSLNVNWKNEGDLANTALFTACWKGHDSVVSILLAHPDIDPNLKQENGWTPFWTASWLGNTSCVRLLLQDHRVMVNEPNDKLETPLWYAAYFGRHDVIKLWIASGREMNLGKPDIDKTDAIGAAKQEKKTEVVTLLERLKSDATKTRSEVRKQLGITTSKSLNQLISSCSSLSILSFHFLGDLSFDGRLTFSFFISRFPCENSTKALQGAVPRLPWLPSWPFQLSHLSW